jgi:hypothetical protein
MKTDHGRIGEIKPRLLPRECGGWLAVSPVWARFSIGVTGATEEEAQDRFRSEFAIWVSLVDDMLHKDT